MQICRLRVIKMLMLVNLLIVHITIYRFQDSFSRKYLSNLNSYLANMVNLLESSGNIQIFALTAFKNTYNESCIIDIGASSRITRNLNLFDTIYNLQPSCNVLLPNGTSLDVAKAGYITLQTNLLLIDVLYIL